MSLGVIHNVPRDTALKVLAIFNEVVTDKRRIEEITDRVVE